MAGPADLQAAALSLPAYHVRHADVLGWEMDLPPYKTHTLEPGTGGMRTGGGRQHCQDVRGPGR